MWETPPPLQLDSRRTPLPPPLPAWRPVVLPPFAVPRKNGLPFLNSEPLNLKSKYLLRMLKGKQVSIRVTLGVLVCNCLHLSVLFLEMYLDS
jgi:hypothetical protein